MSSAISVNGKEQRQEVREWLCTMVLAHISVKVFAGPDTAIFVFVFVSFQKKLLFQKVFVGIKYSNGKVLNFSLCDLQQAVRKMIPFFKCDVNAFLEHFPFLLL